MESTKRDRIFLLEERDMKSKILKIILAIVCMALHTMAVLFVHINFLVYSKWYYDYTAVDILKFALFDLIAILLPWILCKYLSFPFFSTKVGTIGLSIFSGLQFAFIIILMLICEDSISFDFADFVLLYFPEVFIQILNIAMIRKMR